MTYNVFGGTLNPTLLLHCRTDSVLLNAFISAFLLSSCGVCEVLKWLLVSFWSHVNNTQIDWVLNNINEESM